MKYLLMLLPLLFGFTLTAQGTEELPDLGEHSATILSPKEDKLLGKEFMKEVRSSIPILGDTIINDYIKNLGNKLVIHTSKRNKKFHFFVVKDSMINAFAGPDAHIGINSGTITAVNSESELAAVMSHEIAHITQHHIERLIETAKNTQILTLASSLAAIIIGSFASNNSHDNLGSGILTASLGGATQHLINFTKEHEIEADNIGMKILYNSAFDPNAMSSFFERMQRATYSYVNEVPQFLLTHPVTNDRIAESKNRADRYHFKEQVSQDKFYLIRARTQVITCDNLRDTIKYFQPKLKIKDTKNKKAQQYGYAVALYQNQQFSQAVSIVAKLQQQYPHEILFQLLAAQLAVANKQPNSALNILKIATIQYPDYYPLILQYGKTLITTKQYQAACDFIKTKINLYPEEPELYQLLATAFAQNHKIEDAYQAKAKAYEIDGYNKQAIILLRQALKIPKLTTSDKVIINAKIDRLKKIENGL